MAIQYDLNLRDYWRVLRKRKIIIIFTMVAMGVFSFLFSIMQQPVPLYQATASVKVEQSGSITGLYIQTVSWSQTDYMQTQAAIIKSYYVMETVAKKLGLIPSDLPSEKVRASQKYQSIMTDLKKNVETEQEGYSNIINILVTWEDPVFAQRMANTIAHVYKEQHALDLNKRTFEAKKFIESQLTTVKEKLRNSEDAVRKFREESKLISLSAQTSRMLGQMTALQAGYEKSLESYKKINNIEKLLERAGDKPLTSETSYSIKEAPGLYQSLNSRLVSLMLKRDSLLLIYTEKYPQVVEINEQIREIVVNMTAQLSSQKKILAESIKTLKKKIDEMDEQIKALPAKGLELARLEQRVKLNGVVYTLLEKKYQEALIKEAEKIEEVQIVKPALEPTKPVNPPKTMATGVVGTIIGLILGLLFAFVAEAFDTSIGAIEEVEEITGVHVLGIIPHVTIQEIKATLLGGESPEEMDDKTAEKYSRIVSHFAPKSTLAESYRALRTNLSFAGLEGDMKTIAFTSSSPREGKTTIVINLAVTMAQAGNKVLLIDGDMRKPMVANVFGIEPVPGLSDVILGNYSLEDTVRSVTDIMTGKISMEDIMKTPGMDNLYIVTSGTIPPNPAELAGSGRIAELIEQAKSEYDMVLIDTPPLLSATDAAIYGSMVDGVILVYRVGMVGRAVLKRAKAQLDNVRAKVMGIVLNGLKAEISPDFTRHDYYKYYYYYGGGEDKGGQEESLWGKLLSIPGRLSEWVPKKK
ncbi:MAG: polysaccharide biosynthesis tyrosine autokinase [Deltaproteobacteria bacterium]|nr:polysaccharide biosynthesis tyrosine autokinase [Deltaproteobacteria bacterium]